MAQQSKNGQSRATVLLTVGKMARPLVLGLLIIESMCSVAIVAVPTDSKMTVFWAGLGIAVAWLLFFAELIWKEAPTLIADSVDDLEQLELLRVMKEHPELWDAAQDMATDYLGNDEVLTPEKGSDDGDR